MKDEIKEILDEMYHIICTYSDDFDYFEENKINFELSYKNMEKLYDYITNLQEQLHQASLDIQELTEKDIGCPSWCDKLTNLQEENESLKEELKYYIPQVQHNQIVSKLAKEKDNYKSRNEKALEHAEFLYKNEANIFYKGTYKKQLDILNGGDEE